MKYFSDIRTFGLDATCSACGVTTHFTGQNRYRIEENGIDIVKYEREFQCQDCGILAMGNIDEPPDLQHLEKRCVCGGQFRRDKPLFCNACKANKTELNRSDP